MSTDAVGEGEARRIRESWLLLAVSTIVALLQVTVPDDLLWGPVWMLPAVEMTIAIVILVAEYADEERAANIRGIALVLGVLMAAANAVTAALLVGSLVTDPADTATQLLVTGVKVLLANALAYAVLYWLLDGGGPVRRADGTGGERDFRFPQDERPASGWLPHLGDYLYLSYTNLTAFSPTDAMPLTLRAKGLMTVQSIVALSTLGVTLARAINLLPAT